MRDINRILPMMQSLTELWIAEPDLRLGQLITDIHFNTEASTDLFYTEDTPMQGSIDKKLAVVRASNIETDRAEWLGRRILTKDLYEISYGYASQYNATPAMIQFSSTLRVITEVIHVEETGELLGFRFDESDDIWAPELIEKD